MHSLSYSKAPKNSSLSPIRSQKVMPKNDNDTNTTPAQKRPYPLLNTFSSPASIQTTKSLLLSKQRKRKVSFNEKVVVVCTIFDEDVSDEEIESVPAPRRHSTGDTQLKSILIHPNQQQLQQKFLAKTSLKQFKRLFLS